MNTATVRKLEDTEIILEDGTIEQYKPFARIGQKITIGHGYAVIQNGKVAKSKNGQLEIYPKKKIAIEVANRLQG
jgi:hypothetical protein